jgi:hypothetical protein
LVQAFFCIHRIWIFFVRSNSQFTLFLEFIKKTFRHKGYDKYRKINGNEFEEVSPIETEEAESLHNFNYGGKQ